MFAVSGRNPRLLRPSVHPLGRLSLPSPQNVTLITHNIDPLTSHRVLFNLLLEPCLNRLQHRLIPLTTHETDRHTLRAETPCAAHAVQVRVGGLCQAVLVGAAGVGGRVGHVVVDGDVDALDIDAAAEDVGADADAVLEVLELGVALDAVEGGMSVGG